MKLSEIGTRRAALIVGHPGHELRIHGWLEKAQPDVFVLTEGSGSTGKSRIDSTVEVLNATGCQAAGIFGIFTDKELYAAMISRRFDPFVRFVDELTFRLQALDVDYVVADAYEGFSATHDLCRVLAGAAVERLRRLGMTVENYDFLLEGPPDRCDVPEVAGSLKVELTNDAFTRKIAAARNYKELAHEVELADQVFGLDAFRVEWLRPVATDFGLQQESNWIPKYESIGEDRVHSGRYSQALRYREHFKPLVDSLWEYATGRSRVTFQRWMSTVPATC